MRHWTKVDGEPIRNRTTVAWAARRLGVSTTRINQLIHTGRLPAEKFGAVWAIDRHAVILFQRRRPGRPRRNKDAD